MRRFIKSGLLVAFLLLALFAWGCSGDDDDDNSSGSNGSNNGIGVPNPASVFCEEQGYEVEIRDCDGGECGYCVFPDGNECDEWAFYNGDCGQEYRKTSNYGTEENLVASDKQRIEDPVVPTEDLRELAAGNTQFAIDLYQEIKDGEDNIVFSPYSISLALAMTYAGAENDTETQIADVLNFTLSEDDLHPAFNFLDQELESRGEGQEGMDGGEFRLNIANSIWGQEGYDFQQPFLDVLAENYGAGLRLVDFVGATETARQTINGWVEEKTEDKIKDLIPQGGLTVDTRLVLANAVYFNAAWAYPFDDEATASDTFNKLDGSTATVLMMNQTEEFGYVDGDGYAAVELPYDGHELSMLLVMPDEGNFSVFESGFSQGNLDEITDGLEITNLALSMPKFKFTVETALSDVLPAMGMSDAFNPSVADFSGIDGTLLLYITEVFHKAFIEVNEEGTEAAAATAVIIGLESVPMEPITMKIDRPFMFFIRDLQTNTVIFMGRVVNPQA